MRNLLHPTMVLAVAFGTVHGGVAQDTHLAKKLIEWGWDEPDTKFMRQNVEKMEQTALRRR